MNKVIKFGAEWCHGCRVMQPQFEEFASALTGIDIEIIECDVDIDYEISERYNIRSIPTTLFIKNDKIEDTLRGGASVEMLMCKYKRIYATP